MPAGVHFCGCSFDSAFCCVLDVFLLLMLDTSIFCFAIVIITAGTLILAFLAIKITP